MIPLKLNKKTGFKNLSFIEPVIIRDFRGKLFYSTEGLRKVDKFNLPSGNYTIDSGKIAKLKMPVKKILIKLPPPQRYLKPPLNFDVNFGNNPNKCTIFWNKHLILFDYALKEKTLPELYFILYHEFAHSLYKKEKLADLCAGNLMLRKGFNESQIGAAPITSLSSYQKIRKQNMVNKIIRKNLFHLFKK